MTWQSEFNDLQKKEHSLCELLIIRSLIDLTEYDTESEKWKGFVTNEEEDYFEVGLDFIAAKLGFYAWRQIFYSEKFKPVFKEDTTISEILHDFRNNIRKTNKIPKSTSFFSNTNRQLREKIIDDCLTRDILEKTKKKCEIFNISEDGKRLTIENKTVSSFDPIHQIISVITKLFPDPLPSFISTQERTSQPLRKADFDKIREIQDDVCFFCERNPIQVQDHYIPDHFVHETKPSNIVGACNKCNREKWDKKPPDKEYFEKILKRNEEHPELFDKKYSESKYREEYERFEMITRWKAQS
jgi:predicted transcriptional regulator